MKNFIILKSPKLLLTLALALQCSFAFSQITNWSSKGPGGGGALFSPSFSPHDPDELYIACDMSELFHSSDFGLSWRTIDFDQMTGNNGANVRFTNNPQILYCINFENDLMTPHKSTDAGNSWNSLSSDPTDGGAYSLNADPGSTVRLLTSDYTTLFFSSNGGSSFAQKYSNANGCYVAGTYFDSNNIFVCLDNGVLVSTNSGSTFSMSSLTGIPSTESIVSFAAANQDNVIRFFCVTLASGDVYPGVTGADHYGYRNVYSLDWGQSIWTQRISGINSSHNPFFVSMSFENVNIAYLAGGSDAGTPVVYRTSNGGASWTSVLLTTNNQNIFTGWSGHGGDRGWSYGEYALGFQCSPVDPTRLIITDLGFPHISTNGGNTWQQAYVNPADQNTMNLPTPQGKYYSGNGLENTSCWFLTWTDSNNIFGSYSDIRGVRSTDAGEKWSFNYSGHSYNTMYYAVKHSVTGVLYGATSSVHDMYQSTYLADSRINSGTGAVLYSTNKGASWLMLHDFVHPVIWLATDPNNQNRMYASVIHSTLGGIFVSSNIQNGGSSTWTKLSNPPRTEGHPFNIRVLNDGTLLCSYSGRRNSSGTFTPSSGVFMSTNNGVSWIDRSHTGMYYWTKDVVVDPHDATQNTWYGCVFSGWGGPPNGLGGLYKTTNRGINWTKINNLDRVGSCTISPVNQNEMYLSTEVNGLWFSNNINSATPLFTQVQSYDFRQPERIFFNPHDENEVWVTSFGNGIRKGFTVPPPLNLNVTLGIEGFWNGAIQVQDTMKIYLQNNVSPYETIDSVNVLLNNQGNAYAQFSNAVNGNYFIRFEHRNALETWSAVAVTLSAGQTTSLDMTSSQSQAFGNNMKLIGSRWTFHSGDVNRDGIIDGNDLGIIDNDAAGFIGGYVPADLDGNEFVDATDLCIADNNSLNFVSVVEP